MKLGEFIYPWGNGHFSRMMRLNEVLGDFLTDYEIHYSTKSPVYEKLVQRFPDQKDKIHEILMPTPIDGEMGPSLSQCMMNILFPISDNPPLINQIANYLREERRLYNKEKFDLVINDGDMGSNILAKNRNIPSVFVTNQFRPRLWKSRFYFYPAMIFVSKQIAKATRIVVADSAPPYTMCQYNLNFPKDLLSKVTFVGHFTSSKIQEKKPESALERLIQDSEFGYWMRTGNKSTNEGTGKRYEQVFQMDEMRNEKRLISHATNDPSIDRVIGTDGKNYSISEALDKKMDWIQIDVGFLSEQEKNAVLEKCKYAVINGSHTVMGEILGSKSKPVVGIPIYDEHTNQLKWTQERNLGVLANNKEQVVKAIHHIRENYNKFEESLSEFSKNFNSNGATNTAKIVAEILENKK